MKPSRHLRGILIGGLVCSNLLALFLSGYSLYLSRQQFELRAEVLSQNIANTVDQYLSGSIERIDLALRTVADELERQRASQGIDEAGMTAFMTRHEQRLPELEAFRVANADGLVILGKGLDKSEHVTWSDRDYFLYHQSHAAGALQISKPRVGRVAKKSIVNFSVRYNDPDGKFAGVVSAAVAIDHFSQLLSRFNVGPHGTIVLRDADLGQIARFPAAPNQSFDQLGHNVVSQELRSLVDSGIASTTYHTLATPDRVERTLTFRRLSKAPMIVNVGIASEDYLAAWVTEVYQTLAMMIGFVLLSMVSGGLLMRLLAQAERREKILSLSEEGLNRAQQAAHLGSFDWALAPGKLQWSDEYYRLLGLEPHQVEPSYPLFRQCIHPADRVQTEAIIQQALREGGVFECEHRVIWPDGCEHDMLLRGEVSRDAGGQHVRTFGTLQDITQQKSAETELKHSEEKFRTLFNTIGDAVWLLDEKGFIDCNNMALTIFGCSSKLELHAKLPSDLSPEVQACGTDSLTLSNQLIAKAFKQGVLRFEWLHKRLDTGETFPTEVVLSAMEQDGTRLLQAVVRDMTERKAAEDTVKQLAFFDPLTHLPNRRLLHDRLQQALADCARSEHVGALLFIDLDNFKMLNDTLGHDVGDLLLQQVARRLVSCVREHDTVARLGGDEFVVMLEDLSGTIQDAAAQTDTMSRVILATLNQPYLLADQQYHSTASIGATLFSGHHHSVDELMKRADLAMYQAKAAGRNTVRFYDPQMQAEVSARAQLEADLRRGLQEQEFLLHYECQVDGDGLVTGAEALVRWQHPTRGLVSPADFIPLAEDTGLILPLGLWVLETACRQLRTWEANADTDHLSLAVNVSALQFRQPDFVAQVQAVLLHSEANPLKLKLELTESLLLENVEDIIAKMTALKVLGIGFALDDFGTGYSSLSYLKRLPLDQLKIDQSFVHDLLSNPNDAAIARTVVALAQSLGLSVIAEGVRTAEQRHFLAQNGCHTYQGELFSRPLPVEQFEALMQTAMPSPLSTIDAF